MKGSKVLRMVPRGDQHRGDHAPPPAERGASFVLHQRDGNGQGDPSVAHARRNTGPARRNTLLMMGPEPPQRDDDAFAAACGAPRNPTAAELEAAARRRAEIKAWRPMDATAAAVHLPALPGGATVINGEAQHSRNAEEGEGGEDDGLDKSTRRNRGAGPPPSYASRHPAAAAILTRMKQALGDDALKRDRSPSELLEMLSSSPPKSQSAPPMTPPSASGAPAAATSSTSFTSPQKSIGSSVKRSSRAAGGVLTTIPPSALTPDPKRSSHGAVGSVSWSRSPAITSPPSPSSALVVGNATRSPNHHHGSTRHRALSPLAVGSPSRSPAGVAAGSPQSFLTATMATAGSSPPAPRVARRAARLADQIEQQIALLNAMEQKAARVAAASSMRRTAHTIISEWKQHAAAHEDTEADKEQRLRERLERRYMRAQSEAAAKQQRLLEIAERMGQAKKWRVPKGTVVEAFEEPRVSVFPKATLEGETVIEELETRAVNKTLWVRCSAGWIGSQFAHEGYVRVQLVPETEKCEATAREFMLEAVDHINDTVERALDGCPLDRMMTFEEAKDHRLAAQRRRDEVRAIPSGHYEHVRQTWLDMQNAAVTRSYIQAAQEREKSQQKRRQKRATNSPAMSSQPTPSSPDVGNDSSSDEVMDDEFDVEGHAADRQAFLDKMESRFASVATPPATADTNTNVAAQSL